MATDRMTRTTQPKRNTHGFWEEGIEGSFRPIGAQQLYMAWWLHTSGRITRRQLRVYFAAHEMVERRRVSSRMAKCNRTRPFYTIQEVADLVGGRGTPRAIADLKADARSLKAIGLVSIEPHEIRFAGSMDEIDVENASHFKADLERVPNGGRTVPVPRRTLRALAAGFSRAVTGVMLATMIRSLFWHRDTRTYRVDGRTKGSWIAEVFGISRRAVTDARGTLIELGWLEPCEAPQWALNRWGAYDRINTACSADAKQGTASTNDNLLNGGSASPKGDISDGSASPDQTDSLPLKGNLETRKLRHAPSRSGVEMDSGSGGSSKPAHERGGKRRAKATRTRRPTIRDIKQHDLGSMERLLILYTQALELGLAAKGEAGRLDFVSLAERARARGTRSGALFYWLLRERKTAFITQHDEDRAIERIKSHMSCALGERKGTRIDDAVQCGNADDALAEGLTAEDWFVVACIRTAQKHRIDPADVACAAKGWSRQVWEERYDVFQQAQIERQSAADTGLGSFLACRRR